MDNRSSPAGAAMLTPPGCPALLSVDGGGTTPLTRVATRTCKRRVCAQLTCPWASQAPCYFCPRKLTVTAVSSLLRAIHRQANFSSPHPPACFDPIKYSLHQAPTTGKEAHLFIFLAKNKKQKQWCRSHPPALPYPAQGRVLYRLCIFPLGGCGFHVLTPQPTPIQS